ncbi:hypothetical protein C8F01DRAFT_1165928 [Mycena amicta]|nr:hypothetical protein C8F01DRAFT_1165928 [Mycena amicta]
MASGRPLRRAVALFGDFPTILFDAKQFEKNPYPSDDEIQQMFEDEDWTQEEQDTYLADKRAAERNYQAGLLLYKLMPGLAEKQTRLQVDELASHFKALNKGANDARAEDFRKITSLVAEWINSDIDRGVADIRVFDHSPTVLTTRDGEEITVPGRAPYLVPDDRAGRGAVHDITGGLLSTIDVDWKEAITRNDIRTKKPKLAPNYYPRLFYEGFKGDEQDVEEGLFKSRYLVKAARAILSAEAEVDDDDAENEPPRKKPKKKARVVRKTVAELAGLNGKMNGRIIAHVCVILYASLLNTSQWQEVYSGASLPLLYDFIVDFFEEAAEGTEARKRVDALLAWWNQKIFKTHAASANTYAPSVSSRAALRAQRAARERV